MVIKKVKKPKTKKVKAKKVNVDKDDFIKSKKELKVKVVNFLNKQKNKLDKGKFKKLQTRMTKKVSDSKTLKEVLNLLKSIRGSPVQSLPQQFAAAAASRDIRDRLSRNLKDDISGLGKDLKDEIKKSKTGKDGLNLASKYNTLYTKYKNGEDVTTGELFDLFSDTTAFAIDNKEYLPTFSELKSYAGSTFDVLKYIGKFINQKIPLVKKDLPTAPRQDPVDNLDEDDDNDPDDEGDDDDDDEPKGPAPDPPPPPPKPDDDDDDDDDAEPKPDQFGQANPDASSDNSLDPPVDSSYSSSMPSLLNPGIAGSMAALGAGLGVTAINRYKRFILNRNNENNRGDDLVVNNDDIRNAAQLSQFTINAAGNTLNRIRDLTDNSFAVEGRGVGRSATLRNREQQNRIRLQYADRLNRLRNAERQQTTQAELDEAEELAKSEDVVEGIPTNIQVGTQQPPMMESDLVENPKTGRLVKKKYLQSLERREARQQELQQTLQQDLQEGLDAAQPNPEGVIPADRERLGRVFIRGRETSSLESMKKALDAAQPSEDDLNPEMSEFDEPKDI